MLLKENSKLEDISSVQYYSYREFGPMALQCPRKMCNYCKKSGHVIKECPICPPCKTGLGYVAVATLASNFASPATPT